MKQLLEQTPGIARVLDAAALAERGLDHKHAGELVLVAETGRWLTYTWWTTPQEAPDYAAHVDIHNKPGYDPCELFFGWPPGTVSRNVQRIRGSHGRTGPDRDVIWASTMPFSERPEDLIGLVHAVKRLLDTKGV